jgi:transposase
VKHHSAYNPRVLDTHDLPDDVADLKRLVREHRLEIEHLKLQLSRLRRWKFGRSREQLELEITQLQMSLQALQELTPQATPPAAKFDTQNASTTAQAQGARRRSGRHALPAHLLRETVVHPHPAVENGCQCPDCGGRLRYLDRDIAEMLEFVPGYFKVIRHVREKHSCVRCSLIVQAGAPSRPIQRGLPGPALLAHVVASKYCLHQPLYRI